MIDVIDRLLVQFLRNHVTVVGDDAEIQAVSPEDAGTGVSLGLFAYAAVENPLLKNELPHAEQDPNDPLQEVLRRAPLMLDVYYLLTAHKKGNDGESLVASHMVLSDAMRAFHERGSLRGSDLSLEGLPTPLSGPDAELHVTLNPISVEDMTRLWAAFPALTYRCSVSYLVSPVPVLLRDTQGLRRVVERRLRFATAPAGFPEED